MTDIRRRFDHEAAKQTLKEKYEAKMLFAAFGGMWKASPELLSFLNIFDPVETPTIVLKDEYGNPCKVDVAELFEKVTQRWSEQMNAWLLEYNDLQKER